MIISLPLSVEMPRKKGPSRIFPLNLNHYRNSHHMVLNNAKHIYKRYVYDAIKGNHLGEPPFKCTYTIYPANKRKFDIGNICPIIAKFTEDALVEYGLIPDDNHRIIPISIYQFGEVDQENPRCELEIIPIGE